MPPASSLLLAGLYSLGALGIMALNDFKAITGDRQMGIRSLPVMLGPLRAAQVASVVMVVELGLPVLLPGILVALHYAVQISRPRMGFGSDVGGRRTPWIIGGLAVLALCAVGAAAATAWPASCWSRTRTRAWWV